MEVTFSLGLLSSGFLILAPLLGVGLKASRLSRDDRSSAQIAQTLVEEARQGTLPSGTLYLDDEGAACPSTTAAYSVQTSTVSLAAPLSRLTLRVTPVGAPDHVRMYAVVFQAP